MSILVMSLKQATDAANAAQWINNGGYMNASGELDRNGGSGTLARMNKEAQGNDSPAADLVRRLYWYVNISYSMHYEADTYDPKADTLEAMEWPTDWRDLTDKADKISTAQLWQSFKCLVYNCEFSELKEARPDMADQMEKDEKTAREIVRELGDALANYTADKMGARWCYC